MYYEIPRKSVPLKLKRQIEEVLPEPLEVAGWKFNRYVWRMLDQINTKDENGNTDNTVRIGGTGTNDTLRKSLSRGIDITKLTPSVFPDDNLLNGFNRVKNLLLEGYKEWIFAEYEIDPSTKTEFQETKKEYINDFRASANGGDGAKVITKEELIELGRERFEHREDRGKKAVARWVHSLDLNLTKDQVNGIAQTVSKDFARRGIIESYSRSEAEQKIKDLGLGCGILNTKDTTRVLRIFPKIMENYVNNSTVYKFATFHSDAISHKEVDDGRIGSIKELAEQDKLTFKYVSVRTGIEYDTLKAMAAHKPISYECVGHLSQKIGAEIPGPNGLVS